MLMNCKGFRKPQLVDHNGKVGRQPSSSRRETLAVCRIVDRRWKEHFEEFIKSNDMLHMDLRQRLGWKIVSSIPFPCLQAFRPKMVVMHISCEYRSNTIQEIPNESISLKASSEPKYYTAV